MHLVNRSYLSESEAVQIKKAARQLSQKGTVYIMLVHKFISSLSVQNQQDCRLMDRVSQGRQQTMK